MAQAPQQRCDGENVPRLAAEDFTGVVFYAYDELVFSLRNGRFLKKPPLRGLQVTFAFGDFMLDVERRELRREGECVALEPQVFDLLVYLIRNRCRVVSKDDLIEIIWGGRIVSESAVTTRINAARKAIGDNGATQQVIRTIPRKGVRFVAEVREGAAPTATEPALAPAGKIPFSVPDKPSIAVLAFDNMSGDPDQEYFSDGVADDIIAELSRSRSLFVIARNSSFAYKYRPVDVMQVARELGVRYVVEGSVRRSGGRVRINAQLIDAETNHNLWAERYDRDDRELFAVQDEITNAVTTAIQPAVADAELRRVLRKPPESLGTWEAYQRGIWHIAKYNDADNERAIELFQRAIAQDETFLAAYGRLTSAYCASGHTYAMRPLDEALKLAGFWARKAAEIDPRDADVQIALGRIAHLSGRREEAWECVSSALAVRPQLAWENSLTAAHLIFNGQPLQGRTTLLTALRLDPRDLGRNAHRLLLIAISHYYERDYSSAAEVARRAIARYPLARYPNNTMPHRWLAAALGQLGQTDEAREALDTAMTADPKAFDRFVRYRVPWHRREDYEHMLDGLRKAGWQGIVTVTGAGGRVGDRRD